MGKKILIATRTPEGLPGGSGFHLRNMIDVLKKNGHSGSVWHLGIGGYDEVPTSFLDFYLFQRQVNPDVVIADYSWMCSIFDVVEPNVLKICFVHDLRCRIIPCLEKIGYQDNKWWTEEKEAALLQKADVLLVLNKDDEEFCRRMAPNTKIIRIGITMETVPHDPSREIPGRCIYVGSNNAENNHALEWFLANVWSLVRKEVPHASLHVARGYTPDLEKYYAEAQLAVVPHIMNGGLKIKTAETFAHGLPVVGNVCAFDGFGYSANGTDDPWKMAHYISVLLIEDKLRDFSRGTAEKICKEYMTPNSAYGQLLDILA